MTTNADAPVGAALRGALGLPRTVRQLASSPRSLVWLVEFDGSPAIVKQITGGPGAPARYAREVTGLRLAARARPPVVPELLGTDPEAGVLVLEHLPSERPSRDWAEDYARALARLHATTTERDAGQLPRHAGPGPDDAARFLALAGQLGVRRRRRWRRNSTRLCARLRPARPGSRCCTAIRARATTCTPGTGRASWTWRWPAWATG